MPDSCNNVYDGNMLGKVLFDQGKLTEGGLQRALRLQAESRERLQTILTKLGLVSERDVAEALSQWLDLPLASAQDFPATPLLEDRISRKFLKHSQVIPLVDGPEGVTLAMADPLDDFAASSLGFLLRKPILRRVAVPADLDAAYERLYGVGEGLTAITEDGGDGADGEDIERLKDLASEAPVIRQVNQIIACAVEARASDIHIEPFDNRLRVRLRIDGILREIEAPSPRLAAAIVSRVKILAKLNIAERRLAQDGRIRIAVRGKELDLRVSTIPTMHGESVVMRILDRGELALDFNMLGLDQDIEACWRESLAQSHGIVLVTGPTGSGKTTTLYTSLLELNTLDRKILTVEDPVEYQLNGVNQLQVKPQIGLTFASALRSFLRQDPDIIMVGEIRDLETAQIAVQAALTGHLILSTLHTNDAASAVTRLLDMGIEDYLITSTVHAVMGQRLVRRLCPECREPYCLGPDQAEKMGLDAAVRSGQLVLHRSRGCLHCNGTGFHGRAMIAELMVMDDSLRDLVLRRAEARELQRTAQSCGMRSMYQDGLAKALAGITTVEEVLRVTREA